jgi:hypothetical protein
LACLRSCSRLASSGRDTDGMLPTPFTACGPHRQAERRLISQYRS